MERAIPADKGTSALKSFFLTSPAEDIEVKARVSAGALDLRK